MTRFVFAALSTLALLTMAAPATVALNDRFDEARREQLNSLNDRFDEARRQNLNALIQRFDEARWQNLNS
jgi:phosphoglycerate-specific signal transduction histidine kinase